MNIFCYGTDTIPSCKRVIALGFFDGVHIGHRRLFDTARELAKKRGHTFTVFTFSSESKGLKRDAERLYSTAEKLSLISDAGADEAVVADFAFLRDLSAEEFVRGVLIGALGCSVAVTGRDFRFGKGALADTAVLKELLSAGGGEHVTVDDVALDGEKVSSTLIRSYLKTDIKKANAMLGSPYFAEGEVTRGRGVGHALGFPTVNVSLVGAARELRRGVYASRVSVGTGVYRALSNVGTCPTFDEREVHLEAYIIDFNGELYGERIRIYLDEFIRDEIRFESEKDLILQIKLDINRLNKEFEE